MRQAVVVGVVLTAIAAAGEVSVTAQDTSRALRPESAAVRAVMTRGLERSGAFRDLTNQLSRSDLVVYMRFSRCPGDVAGCLLWGSAAPGLRRVLIKLDPFGRSPNELTALLAHELQHAAEVAGAPEIRDLASFQRSFAGRGWKGSHGFETAQATETTKRVTAELNQERLALPSPEPPSRILAQKRVESPKSPSRIIVAGTVVTGEFDPRALRAVLEVLPRGPETIAFVDTDALPSAHKKLRGVDGFVPVGSRVIYLRRQSPTVSAAEREGGPYLMMLAVVIWHEMAHTEGLDERQAQLREEDLWKEFIHRGLVDSATGLTYLSELRRRR